MGGKKTNNAEGGRRAAIVLLTIGLPVLAGLALVYTSYVGSHRQHIVIRDYRVLGTAGRQLAARVRGAFDSLRTEGAKPDPSNDAEGTVKPAATAVPGRSAKATDADKQAVESKVVFEPGQEPGVPWNLRIDSYDPVPVELTDLFALPALSASFDFFVLTQSAVRPADVNPESPALPHRGVLIARDGETIVTEKVEDLIRIEAEVGRSGFLSSIFSGFGDDEDTDRAKHDEKPLAWEDSQMQPLAVVYQGTSYDLFCQPVPIMREQYDSSTATNADGGNDVRFVAVHGVQLCGLVSSATLAAEAWAVPNSMMIAAFLVVLGTFLAWPALKLRLMAREELLEISDVRLLLLAGVFGVGLLTFVIAAWIDRGQLESVLDEDAGRFAEAFESALTAEICAVDAELDKMPFGKNVAAPDETCKSLVTPTYKRISDFALLDSEAAVKGLCIRDDKTGGFIKATQYPAPLTYRQYFRDLTSGRTSRLRCSNHDLAVESIRTRTTGEQTVAIARKTDVAVPVGTARKSGAGVPAGTAPKSGPGVLVGTARMASVIEPALPPGLGFAVIDAQGRVQLHSDPSRNLEENFLEDCEQAEVIRSAMAAHQTVVLNATYRDQPHRLLVRPLADLPWTLVAFRDRVDEYEVFALISLRWLTMFGAYFLAFPLLIAAIAAFWRRSRVSWLWLDDARVPEYRAACLLLGTLLPVCIAGLFSEGAVSVYLLLFGVPSAAVGALYMTLGGGKARRPARVLAPFFIGVVSVSLAIVMQPRFLSLAVLPFLATAIWSVLARIRREDASPSAVPTTATVLHRSYVTMLVLALLNTAVFPAALVFRDAHSLTAEQFVKRGQVRYLEALARHADNQARDGLPIAAPPPGVERMDGVDGVYGAGLFGTPAKETPIPPSGGEPLHASDAIVCPASGRGALSRHRQLCALMVGALESYVPSLQMMAKNRASDADWCWSGDSKLTFDVERSGLGAQLSTVVPSLRLVGAVDRLRSINTEGRVIIALAGLGIVLLVLGLVRWVVKRLFVIGENDPWLEDSHAPGAARVWLYVARCNEENIESLLELPATRVDLQGTDAANLSKAFPDPLPADTVFVIDHLEANLASHTWAELVLPIFERVVFAKSPSPQPIVFVSEIDALWYLSQGFGDSEPEAEDTQAIAVVKRFRRWSQLLGACRGVHLPVPVARADVAGETLRSILAAKRPMLPEFGRPISEGASWRIWSHSSKAEKLTMTQLAREGFVNPNNREVISRLMVRGLVYRTPAFRFFHRSFAGFVARAEPLDDIHEWEKADAAGSWARLQRVLVGALVVVVGFFMLTQDDAYRTFMALLAAVTTAVPAILAFGKLFTRDRDPQQGNG